MERPTNPPSFTWMYTVVVVLVAVPTFALGVWVAWEHRQYGLLAAGVGCIAAVLVMWPLLKAIEYSRAASVRAVEESMATLNERVQQLNVLLTTVSEHQLLSDRAKAVAFREKDRDALRRAIHEEMGRQDWEAALVLANDIEKEFGYKQEADRFREEINQRWQAINRREISEGAAQIERFVSVEQWQNAHKEAERLIQRFPNDPQVKNLPTEIDARRNGIKKQLLERWQAAVARNDVDGSIDLLKQLDLYLTPQEAESLQEPARHIFKEKLNSLRTQFSLAVQDHKWREAIGIGDTIMRDFPNTRIAQEVREKMEAMRERAGQAQPAGA